METQLPLPAGWARRKYESTPDPLDRLDELRQGQLDVKADIRALFDRLADRFGIQPREVDRAMDSIEDTISDLSYEVEEDLQGKIIDALDTE